ncbi:MAG: hypothetical protein IKZ82_00115 [Clostridia bacterium]|nr:hypothetical protein [Clostridia bacterium]
MKKKINTAVCDARKVGEESLAGFEQIEINTAMLIVDGRSKALLNKYSVAVNAASVIELPDENARLQNINGKHEIGPDADGNSVFLIANGRLTLANGSLEAAKSYLSIMVNGEVLMPKSFMGQLTNLTVNGDIEYYPDGAAILKENTVIDELFVKRAKNKLYYCSGKLFFLDAEVASQITESGIGFSADSVVIAEGLVDKLVRQIDEEAELITVPDGTRVVDGDLELNAKAVKKYGTKLFICGDVSIDDASALASVEYLNARGAVKLNKALAAAFDELDCAYDELKIIDPDAGYICERPIVKIGSAALNRHPNGLYVTDCAKVMLDKSLAPSEIMAKLHINDCAVIVCTKEQEDAVNLIAVEVANICTADEAEAEDGGDEDIVRINAAEYSL